MTNVEAVHERNAAWIYSREQTMPKILIYMRTIFLALFLSRLDHQVIVSEFRIEPFN